MSKIIPVPDKYEHHPNWSPFKRWLLEGHPAHPEAPHETEGAHKTHPWWKVMCLTGVDYFSTLGYQPGIAAIAAGVLAPQATFVLVLLTLFGALPMYCRVAQASPHGDGSISMLERVLAWWQGKLFVLALIGFVATGFIITITLSAADAAVHMIENPLGRQYLEGHQVTVTLILIALLGAVFLKGFKEAIGIAVVLVAAYICLNLVVIGVGLREIFGHPEYLANWKTAISTAHPNPMGMVVAALLVFPKLALGLSGFETGVVVMPLIKGDEGDDPKEPQGRIRNARKLLTTAALIMSVLLVASSMVTTLLIPAEEFLPAQNGQDAGEASGRALAYLAHKYLGDGFGTAYDISTILILWFAGASAMAGLLNIVPRYLPRYGMAPEWTRAARPLVLIFTLIACIETIIFKADVAAQGGAYATGVLSVMASAAIAVTISAWRANQKKAAAGFALVSLIFLYTTLINIIERPDGLRIALTFIFTIVVVSLISRVWRTLELRVEKLEVDDTALRFIAEAVERSKILRILPNHPEERDVIEYEREEKAAREDHQIPPDEPLLFLEVYVRDASEFAGVVRICGTEVSGYKVLRADGTAIPNAIAAVLLYLRDTTGKRPHAYFNWSEGNPLLYLMRYVLSGQGDIAPVTREILRQAEPNPEKRPAIHAAM
jgi:hypothetical protein